MQIKQVFSDHDGKEGTHLGQFKYCPFCGTPLSLKEKGGKQRPACPNCGFVQFRNPAPGAVVVIEKEGYVLLGKRGAVLGQVSGVFPKGTSNLMRAFWLPPFEK